MYTRLAILLAVLLAPATLALGQAAATDFTPGGVRYAAVEAFGVNKATFTADNPAALLAQGPSVVGGGGLRHKADSVRDQGRGRLYGSYGGLRLVGEQAAFAIDALGIRERNSAFLERTDVADAQVAFRPLEWLAIGFGLGATGSDIDGARREFSRMSTGLALSFGWLHLGYATEHEDKKFTPEPFLGLPYTSVKVGRNATHWGVALRKAEGWRWLLAYDVSDYQPFDDAELASVPGEQQGLRTETATVQTVLGPVLLGYNQADVFSDNGSPFPLENLRYSRGEAGWVPQDGLAIVASRSWLRWYNPDPLVQSDQLNVTTAVTASWLF